jgi:hypothetical protein
LLLEKKLALDAVIGVLGVLLVERFGGGVVVLRLLVSPVGTGNEEILLLNEVPSGSKFNGGSLRGCRFFLFVGGSTGGVSGSPDAVVKPLLCRIVCLSVGGGSVLAGPESIVSVFCAVALGSPSFSVGPLGVECRNCGTGFSDDAMAKENLLCSGSLGDSYAFGIAGTGGTSSSSSGPAELCTFRGFGVGRRDPEKEGLPRGSRDEGGSFNEFMLELDESDIPEA